MNYNKLDTYSVQELNNEVARQNRSMTISILGAGILFLIIVIKIMNTNQLDWTLLLPISFLIMIVSTRSYKQKLKGEIAKRFNS